MEESTSKEKVLKHVREALISRPDQPFPKLDMEKPVFVQMEETPDINFAQELTKTGGHFIYCESTEELIGDLKILMAERNWEEIFALEPSLVDLLTKGGLKCSFDHVHLKDAKVAMTLCENLVARLGSVVVSSGQRAGRQIFVHPEVQLVLAFTSQIVNDLKDAISSLKKKYESRMPSMITLITGPSRTADIEKTLVMGAHGPKELFVFLLEDRI